jgi:hypothetical protein
MLKMPRGFCSAHTISMWRDEFKKATVNTTISFAQLLHATAFSNFKKR